MGTMHTNDYWHINWISATKTAKAKNSHTLGKKPVTMQKNQFLSFFNSHRKYTVKLSKEKYLEYF